MIEIYFLFEIYDQYQQFSFVCSLKIDLERYHQNRQDGLGQLLGRMIINPSNAEATFVQSTRTQRQGMTLSFQARGPKRSFDKNKCSNTGFLVILHTILGP